MCLPRKSLQFLLVVSLPNTPPLAFCPTRRTSSDRLFPSVPPSISPINQSTVPVLYLLRVHTVNTPSSRPKEPSDTYISPFTLTPCHRCLDHDHHLLVFGYILLPLIHYLVYLVHLVYPHHYPLDHTSDRLRQHRLVGRNERPILPLLHSRRLDHYQTTRHPYHQDIHSTLIILINQIHHLQWPT